VMLTLAPGVLNTTFEHLRRCGANERECVVVWVAPIERPDYIGEVLHPAHLASAVHCDFDPVWIGKLWLDLDRRRRTVRAQVHSHPGSAYHSARDDQFPLIHTPGFVSVVIPNFASGDIGLSDAYVTECDGDGGWRPLDVDKAIEEAS
jgi:hypothetical protein